MNVQDVAIVLWVVLGCAILLILTAGAFWWGTRPSIWDEPKEGRPPEAR